MTAWLIPDELRRPSTAVVGETFAVFVRPHRFDQSDYKAKQSKGYEGLRCTVTAVDPLTVTFDNTVWARSGWSHDGEPYRREFGGWPRIPAGTPVQVPHVHCPWSEFEAWRDTLNAAAQERSDRALQNQVDAYMADLDLIPSDRLTVTVDAAALSLVCRWAVRWRDEDNELKEENAGLRLRVQELEAALDVFEAEEQADVLRAAGLRAS